MSNQTKGSVRELLDSSEIEALVDAGVVIKDESRRRTLYFDGRFLAASDLIQDQEYFLDRERALAKATGEGVVTGLHVGQIEGTASRLTISPGHGTTASGEMVVLPESLTVDLSDVPQTRRLNAAFGLSQTLSAPIANRTGLYLLMLRPVEYTANPIASYPTSIEGERTKADSDIIQAVVVTMTPYADNSTSGELELRQRSVARDIFVRRVDPGVPAGGLPLAMIALNGGVINWIDEFMVRREVGAKHGDVLGLGFAPRALRQAHVLQYDQHLDQVLERRGGNARRFTAADEFDALPPAGRMPMEAVDPASFTQVFFPPEIDVDLSIVPEDELPALVEESLLLPPIDLTLPGAMLESTSVLVVIPVPRAQMRLLSLTLPNLRRALRPAAPAFVAQRRPLEILRGLVQPLPITVEPDPEDVIENEWRRLLSEATELWFLRRRNLHYKEEISGMTVAVTGDELAREAALLDVVRDNRMVTRLNTVREAGSAAAGAEAVSLLGSPVMLESRTLMDGALTELEDVERKDTSSVLRVSERFGDTGFGEGVTQLEAINPNLTSSTISRTLAETRMIPELDKLTRLTPTAELPQLAEELEKVASGGDAPSTAEFIATRLERVQI